MRAGIGTPKRRRVALCLGVIAAFIVVAAPSCTVYNGGGIPNGENADIRVAPLFCQDGAYIVATKERHTIEEGEIPGSWTGGDPNRISVMHYDDPLEATWFVLLHEDLDFQLGDPATVWPGWQRLPTTEPGPTVAFATVKVPWREHPNLGGNYQPPLFSPGGGAELVMQRYTSEALNPIIVGQPPPLAPDDVPRFSEDRFQNQSDPESAFERWVQLVPDATWETTSEEEGSFTYPSEFLEPLPEVQDCWLFPTNVSVSVTPGNPFFVINPSSTFAYAEVMSTPSFDATTIDAGSVRVGKSTTIGHHLTDFDHDGDLDLFVAWNPSRAGLSCANADVTVRGTYTTQDPNRPEYEWSRRPFTGTDTAFLTSC